MRILVVDDESLNRFLLVHMLEEEGFLDVYEARSGHEAVLLAEKIAPDIVLLDVVMPGMDGFEVAQKLKSNSNDAYLPIIFITSLDDQATVVKCLAVGGDDFASKPFDKTILMAKVKAHARTRELSKRIHKQNKELTYFRHSVEREHEIIEHIFSQAIVNNPKVSQFFDYRLFPAAEFSGDVFLCEASPNGGLYFLVGDFTGHGLASAIGALPVTRAFQAMARKGLSVSEIASTLNRTLVNLLPINMFFAAVIVEVSENGCRLNVWNGGMPQLLLQSKKGELIKRFHSRHMALGILEPNEFEDEDEVFDASHGSRLLAFSDGLNELSNDEGEMFGEERIEALFIDNPNITVEDLLQPLRDFNGDKDPVDDITLTLYTCTDLSSLKRDNEVTPISFDVSTRLEAKELKQGQAIQHFIDLVCSQMGLSWIRSDLFTILTELYSNSLEHGILGIDSKIKAQEDGFIEYYSLREERLSNLVKGQIVLGASFDSRNRLLTISVQDSGRGFDINALPESDGEQVFGRGIPMLRELCESLEYEHGGTLATVTLTL